MSRPKGANPPKPAKQGSMAAPKIQQPKPQGNSTQTTPPATAQNKRGFRVSPIGGSKPGAR